MRERLCRCFYCATAPTADEAAKQLFILPDAIMGTVAKKKCDSCLDRMVYLE